MMPSAAITPRELQAGTYRLDSERSTVGYTSKHMFGLGSVHAVFRVRSGELRLGGDLADSSVEATVDAASFTSDIARRDRDVRSPGLLDVATYPEITFASAAVRATGDDLVVEGTVTAHGRSVPVELAVTSMTGDPGALRVRARVDHLDRYAFGITGSKGLVGRFFDLDLDVLAVRA